MRVLKFPSYDADNKRQTPVAARGWIILYHAVNSFSVGDKVQTATLVKAVEAVKEASEITNPDEKDAAELRRLTPGGAEVFVEDAEWRILDKAVEAYRKNVQGVNADALYFLDVLLDKAPTISKQKYAELTRREKPALKVEG